MENVPVHHADGAHASHKLKHVAPKKRMSQPKLVIASVVTVVILALVVAGSLWAARTVFASPVKSDQYQAVFLSSGQVYFGKLDSLGGDYLRLTDVFYIQATANEADAQNPQDAESTTDLQLIKLGSEVHGPEDEMLINNEQILFVENLKADGKVTSSIRQYYDALNN